jgi:multidrug resistance efflux pump
LKNSFFEICYNKTMSKKIILIVSVIIIIIGGVFIYRGFIQDEPLDFVLEKVFKGDVYQEVVETGVVRAGEEINLSFKNMGRIERIDVEVGEVVQSGQILAKIDAAELLIKLSEAKAALDLAEIGLARLKAGASKEEIAVAQTAVENLERQLADFEKTSAQRITQARLDAKRGIDQAHERGLTALISAELKIDSAFWVVDSIQRRYFTVADREGIKVRTHKIVIEKAKKEIKSYLEIARNNPTHKNIAFALLKTRQGLETISNSLVIIRDICDAPAYRYRVSDVDRTSLDLQRTHITSALASIVNVQQGISSAQAIQDGLKVMEAEITLQLTQIKGQLNTARKQLERIQAEPRQIDIDLHQAQIDQVRARKTLLEEQIQESVLRAPVKGKITEIFQRKSEIAQPIKPIISLLPKASFQIEVDIYEEDIVKVEIGNPVEINLIAFPDKPLKGKVVSIDPTEVIVGGVVYYKTTIVFVEELPKGVRPGIVFSNQHRTPK